MKCLWEYWLICFLEAHIIVLNRMISFVLHLREHLVRFYTSIILFTNITIRILNPNHVHKKHPANAAQISTPNTHSRTTCPTSSYAHRHPVDPELANVNDLHCICAVGKPTNEVNCVGIAIGRKRSESKWKMILHPTSVRSSSKCDQKSTIIVSRIVRIACPPSYPLLFAQR